MTCTDHIGDNGGISVILPKEADDMGKSNPLEIAPGLKQSFLFPMLEMVRILEERFAALDKPLDLTIREAMILLATDGTSLRQGALADALNINRNVMVGLIDGGEKKDLWRREPSSTRRGEWIITPTAKGKKALQYFRSNRKKIATQVFDPLPSDDVEKAIERAFAIIDGYYK